MSDRRVIRTISDRRVRMKDDRTKRVRTMIAKDEESTKDDRDKKSENEGREDEERCVERRVMSQKDQEIRCEGSSSVQEIIEMSGIETTHWDRSKDDSERRREYEG